MRPRVYVASRTTHAEMWQGERARRADKFTIVSTWIDEAAPGASTSLAGLWERIVVEVTTADGLILYVEPDDFPLKGALVEVGMALAAGVPVFACLPGVVLEQRSMRPVGSWMKHPIVTHVSDLGFAFRGIRPLFRAS